MKRTLNNMHASWIFKPKHGPDIYEKVIRRFANVYLDWHNNGIYCHMASLKDGWVEMQATCDGGGSLEYYGEMCFTDHALTGEDLTEHMMILLVEAGIANECRDDVDDSPSQQYTLEDVDICDVLAALSQKDTNIYSPYGSKCWVSPVPAGPGKTVDILDALLTLQAA